MSIQTHHFPLLIQIHGFFSVVDALRAGEVASVLAVENPLGVVSSWLQLGALDEASPSPYIRY